MYKLLLIINSIMLNIHCAMCSRYSLLANPFRSTRVKSKIVLIKYVYHAIKYVKSRCNVEK